MSDKQKGYIKSIIVFAILVFSLCCYIKEPIIFANYTSYSGYAITSTTLLSIIYVKWGWRWNPLEKIPRLNQNYIGKIEYRYNGVDGEKATNILVKQSLFSTRIKIITDEITSASISSEIIEENGAYVMYYTYITNPKGRHGYENPMQYGTCRLELDNVDQLTGRYWTSRNTTGDIYLNARHNPSRSVGFVS